MEVHPAKSAKRARVSQWIQGDGIEIGALHNPLQLPPGARVRYVDRMTEGELRSHYPELAAMPMAPVSIIGDAQNLTQLDDRSVDFVIASHLLEHLEDPISGLLEMRRVLRDEGVLYIALPDPRATFDRNRPLTPVRHLLDEHRGGTTRTRRAHFEEWVDLVESQLEDYHHVLTGQDPEREARVELLMRIDYSIHFHVWRAETFLDLLAAARAEFGLDFELLAFEPCIADVDDEFILVLRFGSHAVPARAPRPLNLEAASAALPAAAPPDDSSAGHAVAAGRRDALATLRAILRRGRSLGVAASRRVATRREGPPAP